MNYVYDLLLNFNREFYDFYDWNSNDLVSHIRKILIFRVNDKTFQDLKTKSIMVNTNFLIKLSNRTEMFTSQNVKMINYATLFTNGLEVIGVRFDKSGLLIERSSLLVDEEAEIIDNIDDFEEFQLDYKVLKEMPFNYFKTRKEREIERFINRNLKQLNVNDSEKLKYLYYECFNRKEENVNKIMIKLKKELKNNWDSFYDKVYNFFKLISAKEK